MIRVQKMWDAGKVRSVERLGSKDKDELVGPGLKACEQQATNMSGDEWRVIKAQREWAFFEEDSPAVMGEDE